MNPVLSTRILSKTEQSGESLTIVGLVGTPTWETDSCLKLEAQLI